MKKTGLAYEPCFTQEIYSCSNRRHRTMGFNHLRFDGLLNLQDLQFPGRILRMRTVVLWEAPRLPKLPAIELHINTSSLHDWVLGNCTPASVCLNHSPLIYWKLKTNRSFGHKSRACPRHFHPFHTNRFDTSRCLAGCSRVVRVRPVRFLGLWVQSVRS